MTDVLTLSLSPLHKTIALSAPTTEYMLAKITAAKDQTGSRPRLCAVLVLDISGSMQGEPLAQVVRSAHRLSELLSEEDSLGLVVFSNSARIVAPLAPLRAAHRRKLQQELTLLRAGGGTNISAGLAQASMLFPNREKEERFTVLLLTDGQPTEGATTKEALARDVSFLRRRDIAVSALGFGASHNEELLVEAASAGGGRYFYISDAKLAEGNFARALGSQRDVLAEQAKLSLRPGEGVEIVKILGDPKISFGMEGLQVSLPDVVAGDDLHLIVELSVASGSCEGRAELMRASFRAQHALTHEPFSLSEALFVNVAASASPIEPEVGDYLAIAQAADLRDQARQRADKREFNAAKALLTQAKAILEAAPRFVFGEQSALTDAWETIADDISAMEREPDEHEYQEFRKSQRDYLGFAAQGTSACGGGLYLSPSARAMAEQAQAGPLPEAYLVITEKGGQPQRLQLTREMTIGRVQGNTIVLPKGNVSKQNARICFSEGRFWVFDMKSTNGTYINNRKLSGPQPLNNGDKIYVGDFELRFEDPSQPQEPTNAPSRPPVNFAPSPRPIPRSAMRPPVPENPNKG